MYSIIFALSSSNFGELIIGVKANNISNNIMQRYVTAKCMIDVIRSQIVNNRNGNPCLFILPLNRVIVVSIQIDNAYRCIPYLIGYTKLDKINMLISKGQTLISWFNNLISYPSNKIPVKFSILLMRQYSSNPQTFVLGISTKISRMFSAVISLSVCPNRFRRIILPKRSLPVPITGR